MINQILNTVSIVALLVTCVILLRWVKRLSREVLSLESGLINGLYKANNLTEIAQMGAAMGNHFEPLIKELRTKVDRIEALYPIPSSKGVPCPECGKRFDKAWGQRIHRSRWCKKGEKK